MTTRNQYLILRLAELLAEEVELRRRLKTSKHTQRKLEHASMLYGVCITEQTPRCILR